MQIMHFTVELTMLRVSVFQKTNFLSQVTVDRLDSALAFTVINGNLNVHNLIRKIQYLWNPGLNSKINSWLQTTKASLILQFTFKLEVLRCQPFYTLFLYVLHFQLTLLLVLLSFLLFYICNSLTLQHLLILIRTHRLHLLIRFRSVHRLGHSQRFDLFYFDTDLLANTLINLKATHSF